MTRHGWRDHREWRPPWMGEAGGPPWAAFTGFGPPRGGRGPKVRRGDVRLAILSVLAAESMNGYQIIQQIAERSGGAWKPSPGSVYPTLQQLEDEGLVRARVDGDRRVVELTEAGREYVEANADQLSATWRGFEHDGSEETSDLRALAGQIVGALWQIGYHGGPEQREQAAEVLTDTRRRLYALLAEGDPE
jgi:DNA-binding PadR family transcriptional regulator